MRMLPSLLVVVLSLCAARSRAQPSPGPTLDLREPRVRAAIDSGLRSLRALATPQSYARFGFATFAEVGADLRAETPLCETVLTRAALESLAAGRMRSSDLPVGPVYVVPLSVQTTTGTRVVRSSMSLAETPDGRFEVVAFGNGKTVARLTELRDEKARERGVSPASFCLVRIPSVPMRVLSFREGGEVSFVALADERLLDARAGTVLSASSLAARLVQRRPATAP